MGLDVAWDLYIGAGTILFALCMFGRRGLGAWLAVPGVLIGVLLLIFNIATFPKPPADAGLVDVGPLVGLWYLVIYVRLGVSSVLLKRQQRRSISALSI
jgi:peptidoglycan/LPS O-acetylase OafA/YrhL